MLADKGMEFILSSQTEIDTRIYDYPKAAFTKNGIKLSYHTFLSDPQSLIDYPILKDSLIDIEQKLSIDEVKKIIDNTPAISSIRNKFYTTMLEERYHKILEPAFELAKNFGQMQEGSDLDFDTEDIDGIDPGEDE